MSNESNRIYPHKPFDLCSPELALGVRHPFTKVPPGVNFANENERPNFGAYLFSSYFLCNKTQNERQDLRQNLKLLVSTKPCADI